MNTKAVQTLLVTRASEIYDGIASSEWNTTRLNHNSADVCVTMGKSPNFLSFSLFNTLIFGNLSQILLKNELQYFKLIIMCSNQFDSTLHNDFPTSNFFQWCRSLTGRWEEHGIHLKIHLTGTWLSMFMISRIRELTQFLSDWKQKSL